MTPLDNESHVWILSPKKGHPAWGWTLVSSAEMASGLGCGARVLGSRVFNKHTLTHSWCSDFRPPFRISSQGRLAMRAVSYAENRLQLRVGII